MDAIGDLGDIQKVQAMLHQLFDGAQLKLVDGAMQLVLKPLPPPK